MHTLAQVREGTGNDNDSLSMPVNFLCNLAEKYSNRLNLYKLEFERAEFSLKCMVGVQTPNAQGMNTGRVKQYPTSNLITENDFDYLHSTFFISHQIFGQL